MASAHLTTYAGVSQITERAELNAYLSRPFATVIFPFAVSIPDQETSLAI